MPKGTKYEKGLYRVRLSNDQRFDESEKKKTPFFEIGFQVLHRKDPVTNEPVKCPQEYRKTVQYLTEKTIQYVAPKLKALGMEGDFRRYDPSRGDHISLAGREVDMWCGGQDSNGYDMWEPSARREREVKPSNPQVTSRLDNVFSGVLGKTSPKPAPKQEAAQETVQELAPESQVEPDLPF